MDRPRLEAATPAAGTQAGAQGRDGDLVSILRGAWADVDLDALEANFRTLVRRVGPAGIMAVVKADAYGHGAVRVARRIEELGVDLAAVALLEEAAELRRAGIALPILVLGPATSAQLPLYRRYRLIPTASSLEQVALWRRWAGGLGALERQHLHLKVDTGMNRLGMALEEVGRALELIRGEPKLRLAGVLSHFAEAEQPDSGVSRAQEDRFAAVLELLSREERRHTKVHLANSAGALHRPGSRFDLVRLGLSLYGLDPAGEVRAAVAELLPVMSVTARIVSLRWVARGARVSYGGRWTAPRPSLVAVVPVGYADGYPWRLGADGAEALVFSRRVPVVGSVTMDMTMLDVTDARGPGGREACVGDEVMLMGRQGEVAITAGELARRAGTIPYEVLCRLGQRLARRYFQGGRLAGVASGLVRS